jgi:hypothetical protein
MRLTYRGTSYNHEVTPLEMIDSGLMGAYRGQAFSVSYPRHVPAPQTLRGLTYRGVTYHITPTGDRVAVGTRKGIASAVASIEKSAKSATAPSYLKQRSARNSEYDQVHQLHIRRRLQQRIEAAKARGDYKLLSLLESEMQQAG